MDLILSQNFESLLEKLSHSIQKITPLDGLIKQWILVPDASFKSWVMLKLAKYSKHGGIAGCQVATIDEMLSKKLGKTLGLLEMRCWIYQALSGVESLEVKAFISKSDQAKIELSNHLSDLFSLYGQMGVSFEEKNEGWQERLFRELFSKPSLQLPMQKAEELKFCLDEPIHCFGFDFLGVKYWEFLSRCPHCKVYLFSPSIHFWEDVCTDREQKKLFLSWKAKGVSFMQLESLQKYFSETPSILANLGKLGRETLKILDAFVVESEELYLPLEESNKTVLHTLQSEILLFEKQAFESIPPDGSIEVFKAGASRLNEVENLKEKICFLIRHQNLQFSDILVLAPDIQLYVPLIEYVFFKEKIPYRFSSVPLGIQSSFYQGIARLLDLVKGPWTQEKILALFETRSFFLKHDLELSKCSPFLEKVFQLGSDWKQGVWSLLEKASFLFPGPSSDSIPLSTLDEWEKCFLLLQSLEEDLEVLKDALWNLSSWGEKGKSLIEKYLKYDFENELDVSSWTWFCERISHLFEVEDSIKQGLYPFSIFEDYLLTPGAGSIHGNHLHAVRCASIERGSIMSSKAIFFLGMDEVSFPRTSVFSSLNLLRKSSQYTPEKSDEDRYLILQAILNAKDFLFFSYCHLSSEDGKTVGPSLALQEILRTLGSSCKETKAKPLASILNPFEPIFKLGEPWRDLEKEKKRQVLLSDLMAFSRHPWKYYLQKVRGIYLKDRKDRSFAMEKGSLLRLSLEWPLETSLSHHEKLPGSFDEAFFVDLREKEDRRQKQLLKWGKKQISISFLETAPKLLKIDHKIRGNKLEERIEAPPLEVHLSNCVYQIIGHVPFAMEDGAFYLSDDKIGAVLKNWPEILVSCVSLQSDAIYYLKAGKIKNIENPEEALKGFLEYFEKCQYLLSPLMSDWADALLRKTPDDFSFDFEYEDNIAEWIMRRLEKPEVTVLFEEWKWLRESFTSLITLYPSRSKKNSIKNEVISGVS